MYLKTETRRNPELHTAHVDMWPGYASRQETNERQKKKKRKERHIEARTDMKNSFVGTSLFFIVPKLCVAHIISYLYAIY